MSVENIGTKKFLPIGQYISNRLDTSEFKIDYQSITGIVKQIQIDKKKNSTINNTGTISNYINLNKSRGEIILECNLSVLNLSKNGLSGLFCEATDSNGNVIVFNNMSDWKISESKYLKKYVLKMPFDQPISKIVWGVYVSGTGKLSAQNISLNITDGEFSREWENAFSNRIKSDSGLVRKLSSFSKIWGFLKYYHPIVAQGKMNWDSVLVDNIPKIFRARNNVEYNTIVNNILVSLGNVQICDSCQKRFPDSLLINCDMRFLKEPILNASNRNKLNLIKNNHQSIKNFYVTTSSRGTPNPEFINESTFKSMKLPDVNYRILALFRYWNVINYFYPYKYAIGNDWNNSLTSLIPEFINSRTIQKYHKSILLMNSAIHDSHAAYIKGISLTDLPTILSDPSTDQKRYVSLPLCIKPFEENGLVLEIDSIFSRATGIRKGDIILSINNLSISEKVKKYYPFISASNKPFKDYILTKVNILSTFLISKDSTIDINYVSDKKVRRIRMKYDMMGFINYFKNKYSSHSVQKEQSGYKFLLDSVVYINPGRIDSVSLTSIISNLRAVKAIVIDFRIYPKYYIGNLLPHLINNGKSGVKFQWPNLSYPGTLAPSSTQLFKTSGNFTGQIFVLIDETSLSQSEFWAMQFKNASRRALAIGRATAGADGDVSTIAIPGNIALGFSGIRINYPDGKETQRIGIQPNIEVKYNLNDIISGRDAILEEALSRIK